MAVTLNALTTGVGGLQTTGDTSGAIQLQSNGTATVTVDASGNVGIGTASPTFRLVAANSATDGGWINSSSTVSILGLGGYSGATDGAFSLRYDRSNGVVTFNGGTRDTPVERMRLGNSGEIGVGSTFSYGTSGQFLTSNGPGAAASWTTAAAGGFSNMTVFTSPGTFTTPATTTKIKVTVVGGGGGSNGGNPTNSSGGGGGGGGAIYVGPVTASTGYAVTVGPGGTSPGGTANPGGTSSFASLASATGGVGGGAPTGQLGGAGSAGTLQFSGGAGANSNSFFGGIGGNSILGGGGKAYTPGTGGGGTVGGNYGGGAGGGISGIGLTGAAGVVVVEF